MSLQISRCLNNCLNINEYTSDLKVHLESVCENAVGLKEAKAPFNDHKDLMRRVITEMFNNSNTIQATSKVTETIPTVKVLIESAANLPPMDADGLCDPYIKVFIRGSTGKPLKSSVVYKSLNPFWNEVFEIAVNRKQLTPNQEICIEVWDKDTSSIIEMFRECSRVRNLSDFCNGIRDFGELLVSYVLWTDVDDKIGSAHFIINDIPCLPTKEVKEIKDDYGRVYGTLSLSLDLGTVPEKKITKNREIEKWRLNNVARQMQVYCFFLVWHLKQQTTSNLPDEELLTFYTFLYSPAISLVNQSRIRCNFSVDNDSIIRRAVICELICSKQTDENEKFILLAILSNEVLSPEITKWTTEDLKDFNKELSELELLSFRRVLNRFEKQFKQLFEDKDSNTFIVRQMLMCLRVCYRYDIKYPDANLKYTMNSLLSDIIVRFAEERFSDTHWSATADAFELLNDRLTKYWTQNLSDILGKEKKYQIHSLFMKKWKPVILEVVHIWTENWKTFTIDSHTIFLRLYKATRKLDFILSGASVHYVSFPTVLNHIKELRFGTLFLTTRSDYKMGFRKLFPNSIFEQFIKDRRNEILAQCKKMVDERLSAVKLLLNKDSPNLQELPEDEAFYKICGYSILFYDTFQYWNIELFDLSLLCCLDSVKEYCTLYVAKILNVISTSRNVSKEFHRQLLVIAVNDLFQMSIINLRRVLVERLTDRKADEVWGVFHSFLQKHSEVNNLATDCKWRDVIAYDMFAYKKNESNDRSNEYLSVVRCLIQIEEKLTEITQLKNTLTHPLTNILFTKISMKIKELMEQEDISQWNNFLTAFAKYFTDELESAIKQISSKKTKCDVISECEHCLNYLFKTKFKELHELWSKQKKEVKKVFYKLLVLKWETIFKKAFEEIAVIVANIAESSAKVREETFSSKSYFETEEYNNLSKTLKGEQ